MFTKEECSIIYQIMVKTPYIPEQYENIIRPILSKLQLEIAPVPESIKPEVVKE